MKNHAKVPDWDAGHGCPAHKTPCRKVYEFGRYRDAEVTTFTGCRCAVAEQLDPCGILTYPPVYFTSYAKAAGLATLVKMEYAVKYH